MAKAKKVSVPMAPRFEDTTFVKQARGLSEIGGNKLFGLHDKLNVFSEPTQQSLQARVNDMYRKAELDYQRQYRQAANKMNQANYRRFGTLNATPAAYASNLQEIQNQDHLAKMAQQKAMSYDQVLNNELQRRYNTFNMYKSLYGLGETPLQLELQNWQIARENADREYANQLAGASSGTNWGQLAGTALGAVAGSFIPVVGTAAGSAIGGALGGAAGSMF